MQIKNKVNESEQIKIENFCFNNFERALRFGLKLVLPYDITKVKIFYSEKVNKEKILIRGCKP